MESKRIKIRWFFKIAGIFIIMFILIDCKGGQITTAPAGKKKEEVAPPPSEEELEGKETKLVWSYDPTGKRDPFRVPSRQGPGPNPLTAYNLDQMWIDGIIIGGGGKNIAHIILPDREGYFVKVGDILGINSGVVKEILPDGIVVEEQFLDPVDQNKIRIVEKFLRMETESPTDIIFRK